jgi:hypothetical protein
LHGEDQISTYTAISFIKPPESQGETTQAATTTTTRHKKSGLRKTFGTILSLTGLGSKSGSTGSGGKTTFGTSTGGSESGQKILSMRPETTAGTVTPEMELEDVSGVGKKDIGLARQGEGEEGWKRNRLLVHDSEDELAARKVRPEDLV